MRKHKMFLLPVFFSWPLIIVGLFLAKYTFHFDFFGYWIWVLIVSALTVAFVVMRECYVWKNNALIITNQRVVENEQRGFFSKIVTELLYQDVVEITYSKHGMNASLYDYGDLKIRTAAENEIILEKIADPDETVELINKIRRDLSEFNSDRLSTGDN